MTIIDLATPKLAELDDARATIERLAHANQALTQRLDREHSMRLAAEERIAALESLTPSQEEASEMLCVPEWVAERICESRRTAKLAPTKIYNDSAVVWLTEDRERLLSSLERMTSSERIMAARFHDEHAQHAETLRRAHEAEAALEALRADVERDRVASRSAHLIQWYGPNGEKRSASAVPMEDRAVASVCELLAAWGRFVDRNNARGAIAEARAAALLDAKDAASGAIGSLAWGNR